jgi:hypothetical protein
VEARGASPVIPEPNGSIWRTSDLANIHAWEKVFDPTDVGLDGQVNRVDVLQAFNSRLYIGFARNGHGTHIYRSATGDRYTWEPVVTDGFGAVTTGRIISDASAILGSALYVGVMDVSRGATVWRTYDGLSWTLESSPGFSSPAHPATFAAELIAFNGVLYAWTSNYEAGQGVWRGQLQR